MIKLSTVLKFVYTFTTNFRIRPTTYYRLPAYFFLFSISLSVFSQPTSGYYDAASGKNTSDLRTALQAIIANGQSVTTYDGLWTAYKTTDENSSGKIWDMYSNCTFNFAAQQCGNYSAECDCYNREHSSPQSWFASASPMVSDLFNVLPTDGKVNGERSNYPYGEVGTTPTYTSANGSKLGASSSADYAGIVFEPVDQYKGDLARAYFYMATRYAGLCESWSAGAEVVYSTAHLGFTTYAMNLFLKWSREDPVSAKEILRNNAVYGIQNNRNPFIDNPGLEEYIWGNKTSETFTPTAVQPTYLGAPTTGSTVDFGRVIYQNPDTMSVFIKGYHLTGDLSITLSGPNSSSFSIPSVSISQANAEAGYRLVINYPAQDIGSQTALLTISGGGIETTPINLTATCIDGFKALQAGNIATNSFTANWSSSALATGYSLNVYTLAGNGNTGPKSILETDFLTGLPTGWTSSGYTDKSLASAIKFSSGTNYGKITSPALDISTATTILTVIAKQYNTDAGAKLSALVNSDTLATWTTGVDYQTFTVNVPVKTSTSTISLYAFAGSGHRVYVDYMKLATLGSPQVPVSVSGYPVALGNVLNYSVTDLQSDSTYFYKVTPLGNSTLESDQMTVHTLKLSNGMTDQIANPIKWSVNATGISIWNISANSTIRLLDVVGNQLQSVQNSTSEFKINLSQKGIYLIQVLQNQGVKTYKIIY
jgi:endonuclease I